MWLSSLSAHSGNGKKSDAKWLTCIIRFIGIESGIPVPMLLLILETMAFVDWDSDLYLRAIIATISRLCQTFIVTDMIICMHNKNLWLCEARNCQMFVRAKTFTLLIMSRVRMEKHKPHSRHSCCCFFLPFVGVAGNAQYFVCCYHCCWLLALCKCENLQLDLGLQAPKWIFIIYQKTQLPASKQANERLSESTFV